MVAKKSRYRLSRKVALITAVLVILLVVGWLEYGQHQRQHKVDIPSTTVSKSSATSSDKYNSSQPNTNAINQATEKNQAGSGNSSLDPPSGTFVSNHHPNLSGSPTPSEEVSVCNGTPGSSCTITFTKDKTVKKLAPQVIDGSGSTYWSWDVNEAGFTPGSWQITASASLNGQSKSTQDALALEVQP